MRAFLDVHFAKVKCLVRHRIEILLLCLIFMYAHQCILMNSNTTRIINTVYSRGYTVETTLAEGFHCDLDKKNGKLVKDGKYVYPENNYKLVSHKNLKPVKYDRKRYKLTKTLIYVWRRLADVILILIIAAAIFECFRPKRTY